MKEINIIGPGKSFDLNNLKQIDGPIFLITFWTPLKIDNDGKVIYKHPKDWEEGFRNDFYKFYWENGKNYWHINDKIKSKTWKDFKKEKVTYVLSRKFPLEQLKKNGYDILGVGVYKTDKDGNYYPSNKDWENPSYFNLLNDDDCKHISLVEKVYSSSLEKKTKLKISGPPHSDLVPTGSFLPCLCALSYFAEKINVYGWDFYLDSSPEKMSYWQLFFNMYKYKPDISRSKNHFESALINFYYGYQLSKLPNINIHGYLGQLDKHEKLIKRIEKVLFN